MIFKKLIRVLPMFFLIFASGCSNKTSAVEEELIIQDTTVYYGNKPKKIPVISPIDYSGKITYEYDDFSLTIENDYITANVPSGSFLIKADYKELSTTFTVTIEDIPAGFGDSVNYYLNEQQTRNVQKGSTIFIGDSFFDVRYFWTFFYNELEGNVFNSGIGASTMKHWMVYLERLVYDIEPANIVVHLGNNDFYNDEGDENSVYARFLDFVEDIHSNLPNAHIYFFSTEPRNAVINNTTISETVRRIRTYNEWADAYCSNRDYITFIDSFSHFTKSDGRANTVLLKDIAHPANSEYVYYIKALRQAGLTSIGFKDSTVMQTLSKDNFYYSTQNFFYNNQDLLVNYEVDMTLVAQAKLDVTFQIDTCLNRFDIQKENNTLNLNFIKKGIPNSSIVTRPFTGTSLNIKIVNQNNVASLYIDGDLIFSVDELTQTSCLCYGANNCDTTLTINRIAL